MLTPTYKSLKKNGTTFYVFPGVAEDKNFETQNDNYKMYLSHFVLVNFPRQVIGTEIDPGVLDFENTFETNTNTFPTSFKDQLVESLRNYVANYETTIRNSKINSTTFYYDTFEPYTTTEKIFWKWAKELNIIDFEVADINNDYFSNDPKYNNNGTSGNIDYFKEYLWKERTTDTYSVTAITGPDPTSPTSTNLLYQLVLNTTSNFKVGDLILINKAGLDILPYSTTQSLLEITNITTTNILNDTIEIMVPDTIYDDSFFQPISQLELYNSYERFVQFVSEIQGVNNVQLPDKAYTESYAIISHQHGQVPYMLWNLKEDNNYKPNSSFPILPSEIQLEIQGGENPTNPILLNPSLYPGDIWAQFDNGNYKYTTVNGNILKRTGDYYGNYATSNLDVNLKWPQFNSDKIDGLTMNLNISDYKKAMSYIYPIESFSEFSGTAFDNIAPKDFKFNAVLWYYTIEDVTGNNLISATNLYGVEFLDTPENDLNSLKTKIPEQTKLVSNGFQDGNAFTFSIDTNLSVESGTQPPSFDPDKVYSLFGMELYYEALTRLTYFNDKLTDLVQGNININQKVNDLTGLIYNQQSLESIRTRMNNLEYLLNVYSTLQIGNSDTITAELDTSSNPAMIKLNSIDKQYGYIYQYNTTDMYTEFLNSNSKTQITKVEKTIPVTNGKDFLVVINNNDNSYPSVVYDTTIEQDKLKIVLEKDLNYKQKMDILIIPKVNTVLNSNIIPYPFLDKKIEFYINYNDGNNITERLIKTFDLPVLKYHDGTTTQDESIVKYNDNIPEWKIRNVFYSINNTSDRVFSLIIEDDLINKINPSDRSNIEKLSRIFINNLLLETTPINPSNTYTDISGQYEVFSDPIYMRSEIIDIEIINKGTGYTSSTELISSIETNINIPNSTVQIIFNTNSSGEVISGEILNATGYTSKNEYQYINGSNEYEYRTYDITDNAAGGGSGATYRIITKQITRIDFAINITTNSELFQILTDYDTVTDIINAPSNTLKNIDKYLYTSPSLTLLKGFKLEMVRISDTNVEFDKIDQKYNIKINKL